MGNYDENEMQDVQVLEKLLKNSEKQLFYSRLTSLAAMVLTAAVVVCLPSVVDDDGVHTERL